MHSWIDARSLESGLQAVLNLSGRCANGPQRFGQRSCQLGQRGSLALFDLAIDRTRYGTGTYKPYFHDQSPFFGWTCEKTLSTRCAQQIVNVRHPVALFFGCQEKVCEILFCFRIERLGVNCESCTLQGIQQAPARDWESREACIRI